MIMLIDKMRIIITKGGFMRHNEPASPITAQEETRPILTSEALFKGLSVITIVHDSKRYELRITRQNKLILTK